MILFANLLPGLRLVGCQHLHYSKYPVIHTQLWTRIFSIVEKTIKDRENVILIKKKKKKKTRKESKVYGMLDGVLEQNSYLPVRKIRGKLGVMISMAFKQLSVII